MKIIKRELMMQERVSSLAFMNIIYLTLVNIHGEVALFAKTEHTIGLRLQWHSSKRQQQYNSTMDS